MDLGLFSAHQESLKLLAAILFSYWQRIDLLVYVHGVCSCFRSSQTEVYKGSKWQCDDPERSLGFYNPKITSSQ